MIYEWVVYTLIWMDKWVAMEMLTTAQNTT
jgi:hypothetical protein